MRKINALIAEFKGNDDANIAALIMADIANLNYCALEKLGYTATEIIQAANIVCDSNDSKVVQKVAADVKANDGNKGSSFIDPTPRLQAIVDAMIARRQ
jgi:Holliday junction resolvasome RuvABC DNA-binding subunit